MSLRLLRWFVTGCLVSAPFLQYACSSDNDRTFKPTTDGGSGTGGSSAGSGGSTGGKGGSSGTSGSGGTSGTGGSGASDAGTCTSNADCDDKDPCSGQETCSGGTCRPGTALADDTSCGGDDAGTGDGGIQSVCVDGVCRAKCTQDAQCDDGDVCTGTETCSPTTNTCQQGLPLACDDNDVCTENSCDPLGGCFYSLIDGDGDGHAAATLGSCGDDCDDADETIYEGAEELCDSKDNNCNGQKDELAPTWYADCDGDGFAPTGATSIQGCAKPSTAPPSCATGTWVSVAPGAGTTDCFDNDAKAHPYTAADNGTAWQETAISGAPVNLDFDYNCDGVEEKRYTSAGADKSGTCGYTCGGVLCYCSGSSGYTASTTPNCGSGAEFTSCGLALGGGCTRTTSTRVESCR